MTASNEISAAIRAVLAADPSALGDPEHLRALLHDVAPQMPAVYATQCADAVRYRLPDLIRTSTGRRVDEVADVLASRAGSLEGERYYDVVAGFAAAMGVPLAPRSVPDLPATVYEPTPGPASQPPPGLPAGPPPGPPPGLPPSDPRTGPPIEPPSAPPSGPPSGRPSGPTAGITPPLPPRTVSPVPTETVLLPPPSDPVVGAPVTLGAVVRAPGTVPPGQVSFFDFTRHLGSAPVTPWNGEAYVQVGFDTPGEHALQARFDPADPNAYLPSQSWVAPLHIGGPSRRRRGAMALWSSIAAVVVVAAVVLTVVLAQSGGSHSADKSPGISGSPSASVGISFPPSSPGLSTPVLPDPPEAPTGLIARPRAVGVFLSWDDVPGATRYDVFRDGTQITEQGSTTYNDETADASIPHVYLVSAVDGYDQVGTSAAVHASTASVAIRRLTARIPQGLVVRGSCTESTTDERSDLEYGGVEVHCTATSYDGVRPVNLWFESFPDATRMSTYFDDHSKGYHNTTGPPCERKYRAEQGGWHFKTRPNVRVGGLYCYYASDRSRSEFIWTYEDAAILVWVEGTGTIPQLLEWWGNQTLTLR